MNLNAYISRKIDNIEVKSHTHQKSKIVIKSQFYVEQKSTDVIPNPSHANQKSKDVMQKQIYIDKKLKNVMKSRFDQIIKLSVKI